MVVHCVVDMCVLAFLGIATLTMDKKPLKWL